MVYVGSSWVELDYWTSPSAAGYDARLRVLAYSVQNVETNRSTIYFKIQKRVTGGSAFQYNARDFEISCDDAEGYEHSAAQEWYFGDVSSTSWADVGGDTSDMYWSNVRHNADGTLTLTANAEGDRVLSGTFDTDISITLPTIPRASSPTISPNPQTWSNTTSNTITVTTNRKASSFTHSVRCDLWGYKTTNTGVGASTTFAIPYSTLGSMPADASSFSGSVYTQTYKGSTKIGSEVRTLWTVKVDTSIEHPVIDSIVIHDTNARTSAVTQSDNIYIANMSNLSAQIDFSVAGSYTELASATVTCGNQSTTYPLSGTSQQVTWYFNSITADNIIVTVKDKRGTTVSQTKTFTLIDYQPVTAVATVGRTAATSSVGVGEVTGKAYGGMFGATQNYLDVAIEFKLHEGGTYGSEQTVPRQQLTQSGYNDYSSDSITLNYVLDYQNQYDIRFTVSDLFSTATYEAQLMQGLPVISWDETEVDVWGDLHIHDRNEPHKYQNVLDGFDAYAERDGIKNLIPMTTTTTTTNGITFTKYATYYNINGTATANAFCNTGTTNYMETGGRYIVSGLHDQYVEGMRVVVRYRDNTDIIAEAYADDVEFTAPAPCFVYLVVFSGTTVSNKKWYPMVRDAKIASEEYVRYVPSNWTLNESVNAINSFLTFRNYNWSGSWSNSSSASRTIQITGRGLVMINVYVRNSGTDDTGQCDATIYLWNTSNQNLALLASSGNRVSASSTHQISANAATQYYYDGSSTSRRLRCNVSCTKNGTNSWRITATTINCTLAVL